MLTLGGGGVVNPKIVTFPMEFLIGVKVAVSRIVLSHCRRQTRRSRG
jgi:hypothetical protein